MANTYSKLCNVIKPMKHTRSRNGKKICKITVHHQGAVSNMEGFWSWSQQRPAPVSANYGIDQQGKIFGFVPEELSAFTSSSSDNDTQSVTIEVSNSTGAPSWRISDASLQSLIKLCIDICTRNKFNLNFNNSPSGSYTYHRFFKATTCPGPYLEDKTADIIKQVNNGIGTTFPSGGATASSGGSVAVIPKVPSQVVIDKKKFNLRMCTDGVSDGLAGLPGSKTHQSQTAYLNQVLGAGIHPYIVVPLKSTTNGKSSKDMLGYVGKITDHTKGTSVYAVVGDQGPAKNGWGEVSVKAAWDLGYTKQQANGKVGPTSTYTIEIWMDSKPTWVKDKTKLAEQIKSEGLKRDGGGTAGYVNPRDYLDMKNVDPKLITLTRASTGYNLKTIKKKQEIQGVCIEAGYLYNKQHLEMANARNPKLVQQITECVAATLPYALVFTSKAKTVDEAKQELYQIQLIVQKYPPLLGIWLDPQWTVSKATQHKILDEYEKWFIKFGLAYKYGLYCKKATLNKFKWLDYGARWHWWMIKHVKDIKTIEKLLEPEFFAYDKTALVNNVAGDNSSAYYEDYDTEDDASMTEATKKKTADPKKAATAAVTKRNASATNTTSKTTTTSTTKAKKKETTKAKQTEAIEGKSKVEEMIEFGKSKVGQNYPAAKADGWLKSSNPTAWCADTVVSFARAVGIPADVIPTTSGANDLAARIVEQYGGTEVSKEDMQYGDIVTFGVSSHVEICVENNGGSFMSLGGNSGGTSGNRLVVCRPRNMSDVYKSNRGATRPDWAGRVARPDWSKVGGWSGGNGTFTGSGVTGLLYKKKNVINDAEIREVGYLDSKNKPSIKTSTIKLSVINYTHILSAIFDNLSLPSSGTEGGGGATGGSINLDGVEGVPKQIVTAMMQKGLNKAAAIGIVANIKQESGFDPAAKGDIGILSASGYKSDRVNGVPTSFGLCQWHDTKLENGVPVGRGANMKKFVGPDWETNVSGQMEFLWSELESGYKGVLANLRGVPDTVAGCQDAAEHFVRDFERPGDLHIEIPKRRGFAVEFWNQMSSQF